MVKLDVMERNEHIKIIAPPRAIDSIITGVNHIEKKALFDPFARDFGSILLAWSKSFDEKPG